jgi:hypothetical protein
MKIHIQKSSSRISEVPVYSDIREGGVHDLGRA